MEYLLIIEKGFKISKKKVIKNIFVRKNKEGFFYDLVYFDTKDFVFISNNSLRDTGNDIAMNSEYSRCQKRLPSVVFRFFNKKRMSDILAQELHNPDIKKFRRGKFYVMFKDTI